MIRLDEPWREIARAARLRDWSIIDAIVEDRRASGSFDVRRGIRDARLQLGQEPRLTPLDRPEPVTVHDLPSLDGIEVFGRKGNVQRGIAGDSRTWQRKSAA